MKYTDYEFDGKTYRCRVVEDKDGEELIIGSHEFLDALQPAPFGSKNDGFASKEAEAIYDEIFYFTDKRTLLLDDRLLVEELKIDNPEWFE